VSNTGPYCTGSPISLNSNTNAGGTITYSWTGPNGYTSAVSNPSDATEAGMYELTISSSGCQSALANTTVVINPIPTAQANYMAPFCTGILLQLNGSTASPATATYSWSGPNGYTSTLQNPNDGTEAGTYTLIVTQSGCTSAPATVNVISQVPFVSASNAGPYCEGTPIQLTGFTTASGTISYSWNGPNGYTSQAQNPADITEAGTYTFTVQEGGCSNSASTQVIVKPNPLASFASSAPCMNDSMVFTSACSVPSPEIITNWHWDFNDGFTSSEQNPKHVFQNTGTHSVLLKVTTNSNCIAAVSKDVEVKPAIDANFYFSPSTISALDPTVHFVNSSTNASAYTWNFEVDSAQSTETSPDFTFPAQPGSYAVELIATNEDGCIDSITKIITVQDEMTYYIPNAFTPDGDEFNQTFRPIFSSGFDAQNYTLLLFNRWGETIFESHDAETGWDGTYQGTMVPEGTYIWSIRVKQLHSDAFETFSGHVSLIR
jgi:gliding motility-associated-like protein